MFPVLNFFFCILSGSKPSVGCMMGEWGVRYTRNADICGALALVVSQYSGMRSVCALAPAFGFSRSDLGDFSFLLKGLLCNLFNV